MRPAAAAEFSSLSALQAAALRDPAAMDRLLLDLTTRATPLFSGPAFYRAFREHVVPWLRTYPHFKVWVAGCGNAAEAFSLAIVLCEEGLQDRCRLYVTEACEAAIRCAQAETWPRSTLKRAVQNYRRAGGQQAFTRYCTLQRDSFTLAAPLRKNLFFAAHNPTTDASFNEFHVIVCREAMGDFDSILQAQVHELLFASLVPRGVLLLDSAEQLQSTVHRSDYERFCPEAFPAAVRKTW